MSHKQNIQKVYQLLWKEKWIIEKKHRKNYGFKKYHALFQSLFESFCLDPTDYDLEPARVTHPNSLGNRHFQDQIISDNVQTTMKKSWFSVHQKTFLDALGDGLTIIVGIEKRNIKVGQVILIKCFCRWEKI